MEKDHKSLITSENSWTIKEMHGDITKIGVEHADVILHGCNSFCVQGAGLALTMRNTFGTHTFRLEDPKYRGDINKLGCIDFQKNNGTFIVNCYTQYRPGANADLTAIKMCLKKVNHIFRGMTIAVPQIGCGIGGLDWKDVFHAIIEELRNVNIIIVKYKP